MAFMGSGRRGALSNPFVRGVTKQAHQETDVATYGGILAKCLTFMAMILVGGALAVVLNAIGRGNAVYSSAAVIGAVVFGLCFLICPFIAAFVRRTVPVTGTLTFLATGYVLSFAAIAIPEFRSVILLAAILTVSLVLALQILFATGVIRVSAKLRSVVCACLLTLVIGSLMFGLCALIPAVRPVYFLVMNNPWVCIAFSLIGILLACMCLLSDFYTVQRVVEGGVSRSVEWYVAYSLSYTVVWLFMEILDLLLTLKRLADD